MNNLKETTKVVVFNELGGANVLKVVEMEKPQPKSNEVLIKVKSIGLNRADAFFRLGYYEEKPVFPAKLGFEASGILEAIGSDAKTSCAVGDAVSIIPTFLLLQYNTYGEYIVVPDYCIIKHPANLSFDEAAALWTAYISMYGMLVHSANISVDDFVVINAASSATGLAAIQVANYVGAKTIALTTSVSKKDKLKQHGANHVIVSSQQNVTEEILKITDGKGANVILDPVIGASFTKLTSAAAQNAKIFIYGLLDMGEAQLPAIDMLMKTLTIRAYSAYEVLSNFEVLGKAIEFIFAGVAAGKLKPTIDSTFILDQIVDAHLYMEGNSQFGKIVVKVDRIDS